MTIGKREATRPMMIEPRHIVMKCPRRWHIGITRHISEEIAEIDLILPLIEEHPGLRGARVHNIRLLLMNSPRRPGTVRGSDSVQSTY